LMIFTSQSLSTYHLPFQSMASGLGGQCRRIISFGKPYDRCCSKSMLSTKLLNERYFHKELYITSCLTSL
jgi:hypothetical protein